MITQINVMRNTRWVRNRVRANAVAAKGAKLTGMKPPMLGECQNGVTPLLSVQLRIGIQFVDRSGTRLPAGLVINNASLTKRYEPLLGVAPCQ